MLVIFMFHTKIFLTRLIHALTEDIEDIGNKTIMLSAGVIDLCREEN